ncbi:MAG: hypothetical protein ACI8XM_002718, partial [Haloarculaceae archaeon]
GGDWTLVCTPALWWALSRDGIAGKGGYGS